MTRVFKRSAVVGLVALFVAVLLAGLSGGALASAQASSSFNPSNIVDDAFFDDADSMNVPEIDAFLNKFPGSCISANNGFTAADPVGYKLPLGYMYGGNVTAGRVIYSASQAYGINPQLLIALLQVQQSLVVGNVSSGCSPRQYAAAMGYGCPDSGTTHNYSEVRLYSINGVPVTTISGTCVNSSAKAGFSQQVIHTAWLLKFGQQRSQGNTGWAVVKGNWNHSDDRSACYNGPMTKGTWQRCPGGASARYDGRTTIDGTTVRIANGATAALYSYTPHLSGNSNLFTIITDWFPPSPPAFPVVSEKASKKACFGQWRASIANDSVISGRKGANASQHAAAKAACAQPAPTPAPPPVPVPNGGYPDKWANVPISSVIDSWGFYNRQSPSYAAFKVAQSGRYVPPYTLGNAKEWPARAAALGIPVSPTPAVGDVAISLAGAFGHAMYVESVNPDGSIKVSQYNHDLQGNYSETVLLPSRVAVLKFIHF